MRKLKAGCTHLLVLVYEGLDVSKEDFFHSFKGECIDGQSFQTRVQGRSTTFEYIERLYNRTRRHSTLQSMSPLRYEQQMG